MIYPYKMNIIYTHLAGQQELPYRLNIPHPSAEKWMNQYYTKHLQFRKGSESIIIILLNKPHK